MKVFAKGICPVCGTNTSDYGLTWVCNKQNCQNSANHPIVMTSGNTPEFWGKEVNFKMDGNEWCCTGDDFVNLQESRAGFGKTPLLAYKEYKKSIKEKE